MSALTAVAEASPEQPRCARCSGPATRLVGGEPNCYRHAVEVGKLCSDCGLYYQGDDCISIDDPGLAEFYRGKHTDDHHKWQRQNEAPVEYSE